MDAAPLRCGTSMGALALAAVLSSVAAAEPIPRPDWSVGDSWTFRVASSPPELVASWQGTITAAESTRGYSMSTTGPDAIIALTPDGNVTGGARRRGPFPNMKFPLEAGRGWTREYSIKTALTQGQETAEWWARAVERIDVPAGSFECLRVEGRLLRSWSNAMSLNQMYNQGQVELTYWYCPAVKWFAKLVAREQPAAAATITTTTWELERHAPASR